MLLGRLFNNIAAKRCEDILFSECRSKMDGLEAYTARTD